MSIIGLSVTELMKKIKSSELSVKEIVKAYLDNIRKNKDINAYISLFEEDALKQADSLEGKLAIPIGIKDNMNIQGKRTTCGSKILENFVAPYNATVIEKLNEQNAIFLGKCNMDEFAFGSSTETSYFGPTLNPHDKTRIPGGSSGGSAAAVAGGLAPWSLGSDTGGSIRQPAALCGVVGLKPTYGLVSRYGLVAFASSLDQIGPFTKTVEDSALLLNMIAGHDPKDSTSMPMAKQDYLDGIDSGVKGLRVGLPKEYFVDGMDPEIRTAVLDAAKKLEAEGAIVEEVSLPHTKYAVEVYYIIAPAEASSNLSRFDGVRFGHRSVSPESSSNLIDMYTHTRSEGFGAEAKRRILIGTYSLSAGYYDAYYLKAQKVRTLIKNDFDAVFRKCDCLLTPTSPTTAFKLNEKMNDPLTMYLSDIFTISVNLAGIPAISVPAPASSSGLPIGIQFLAGNFQEKILFRVSQHYEKIRG